MTDARYPPGLSGQARCEAVGVASLLPSGPASRVLIVPVLANSSGALRTGAFLALEGTAAFRPASFAILGFTHGPSGAAALIALSLLLWSVVPALLAARWLHGTDLWQVVRRTPAWLCPAAIGHNPRPWKR